MPQLQVTKYPARVILRCLVTCDSEPFTPVSKERSIHSLAPTPTPLFSDRDQGQVHTKRYCQIIREVPGQQTRDTQHTLAMRSREKQGQNP